MDRESANASLAAASAGGLSDANARGTKWLHALFTGLRPKQWSKNLVLFGGLIFAAKLTDGHRVILACAAFFAYCLASSAAYLVNDVRDAASDRAHPLKRLRPIAAGTLSPLQACAAAAVASALALALVSTTGADSVLFLVVFFAVQGAYSFGIKSIALLDVLAIAGLFVIRASAGAQAVDVKISPWLLLCTAFLALFLGLAKRRAELAPASKGATVASRKALDGYSIPLLDQLITIVAASTISAYALYTFEGRHSKALMITIPFVVFGLFRYLYLVHRADKGEEPESVLLQDRPILVCVAAWAATSAVLLAFT